ncbi:short integuments 2, mitochondrial isoform X4 [Dendrobium catenatum]|uniref:short integuments 2, mitochondrial isoform X4 n=1 Tax=Dendrobium catenatum TaxID=906689 RepID=UPI0009F1F053|nr:short integuments 2, mitochondrial isoform X4 [Dendrobium catenatum]
MGRLSTLGKRVGDMSFVAGGGVINWFPGHMAAGARAIRDRLKLTDLVIEVRDARIPLSSANEDLQHLLVRKRRIVALNKKDLANPNVMHLLSLVELKLREVISREPTLLVMVVGVPNVGKSALINSISQIASTRFPAQEKSKRATVGPFPGVTQDIAGFKIANQPSIYVLDTPGVLAPSIPDIETGLKLALTGAVKDSVAGEVRLAHYLLAVLNLRRTPLHWDRLLKERAIESANETVRTVENVLKDSIPNRRNRKNAYEAVYIEDLVKSVQKTLYITLSEFEGNLEEENELESLIHKQLIALQKTFRIPHFDSDEAFIKVSKKLLILFRAGKLGTFILDDLSDASKPFS